MQLFIISTQSKEEDRNGIILQVHVNIHAVTTSLNRAEALAAKYDGAIKEVTLDKEYDFRKIQSWSNPGYKK